MEIEAESTNNEDQLLNKVILLEDHVIIDGGALLHQVFWPGSTFQEVINEYRRYVSSKYKICQIVLMNINRRQPRIGHTQDVKHTTHHVTMF